uniref:Uncharacterized protein n=1 Tax=Panagrolaimus sp. ES5 TaxID=591445 RepID=A0AC34EZG4_9BILA
MNSKDQQPESSPPPNSTIIKIGTNKPNEYYTDEDFVDAMNYASNKFQVCCNRTYVSEVCLNSVCRYGLDVDYMRSALVTKCDMENILQFEGFILCSKQNMDNYNCCRSFGISHECCFEYMSKHVRNEPIRNPDKFFSQCLDVLKAISYCPILHF